MILLFNKPFDVLCQFTDEKAPNKKPRTTLAKFIKQKNVYAAGRLDRDSEGLVLLTDNGKLQHKITDPKHKIQKTYWAQVEGEISKDAVSKLQQGVILKDGLTKPAKAKIIAEPEQLWERVPPIRERKNIPTSWIELSIKEGRNRQVRRMTAATGFPTLRLIRTSIGDWHLNKLQPGEFVSI